MQKVTDIKNRIKSISDTRKITGAMETISIAKMQKAMVKYASTKRFFEKILETINFLICDCGEVESPYHNQEHHSDKALHIVISSDRGMAGAYNSNVIKHALKSIEKEKECVVYTIGQTARNFYEKKGFEIDQEFMDASFEPKKRDAFHIASHIIKQFMDEKVGSCYISYTHMDESNVTFPTTVKLLPLSTSTARMQNTVDDEEEKKLDNISHMEFDPNVSVVLESLVPKYLNWVIYGALILSQAAEHYSRRTAMSNATKNADEMLEDLTIQFNQARQESITSELIEIVTTTAGVNNNSNN